MSSAGITVTECLIRVSPVISRFLVVASTVLQPILPGRHFFFLNPLIDQFIVNPFVDIQKEPP
jgi:hypothetical protein